MNKETLDNLHGVELEILKEVDRVCKKHGITYFLDSGTALGAIRHKGFIPWDDDIDIAMLRDDYDHFCSIARDELNSQFFFQSIETDNNYNKFHAKIRKNNTKYVESRIVGREMHQGVFIDVVPFDKVPIKFHKIICKFVYFIRRLVSYYHEKEQLPQNRLKELIIRIVLGKNPLLRYYKICTMFNNYGKKYMYTAFEYPVYQHFVFPSRVFEGIKEVEFEGYLFPIVSGYDEYLKIMYGDYMQLPPEDKRVTHDILELKL